MSTNSRLHLFEAFGVELEYMIVDRDTLDVRPIAEVLLKNSQGKIEGEADHGLTAWSNELVSHVIELKSNGPKADLQVLHGAFAENVKAINELLAPHHAVLMPGAAHPWMDPAAETRLWPHESQEIYRAYDRIFNCRGHGWSNLQSTHINLPFYDDEEFARLHTAIRFVLPMIPALTASSPVLDGRFTGYMDKRLYYYEKNQSRLPMLTGKVIPEKLFTRHAYQKHIYDRIASAIRPLDPEGILKPVWLNSRGAMARFDRGAIEIRILDIQECPKADMAVVALLVCLIRWLVYEKAISFDHQQSFETDDLYLIFKDTVRHAGAVQLADSRYLAAWGYEGSVSGRQFWADRVRQMDERYPAALAPWKETLESIVGQGTLAERVMRGLGSEFGREALRDTYAGLVEALKTDRLFMP